MSEEENKAIKYLQHLRKYVAGSDEEEFVLLALTLIEKQNNRLEQLEKENKKLTEARNWYFEHTVNKAVTPEMLHKILREDYVPKSVIREKIKELEKKAEQERKKKWISAEAMIELGYQRKTLKELLGEEK